VPGEDAHGPGPVGDDGPADAHGASRRRRARAAAIAGVLALAGAVAALALTSGSPSPGRSGGGVPAGYTTAAVERRTLVEHSQVDGTLSYAGALELYDHLPGIFTWLPSVGAVISRGGTLFRIDNKPVVLMYGSIPAYRVLKEGVGDGPDVAQLNANLKALGFDPYGEIRELEHFGVGTAAAVRRWQHAEGLSETGEVEFGRMLFAPGQRRVTALHVSVGQDPPGNSDEARGSPDGSGSPGGASSPSSRGKPGGAGKPSSGRKPGGAGKPGGKGKPRSERQPGSKGKPSRNREAAKTSNSNPSGEHGAGKSPSGDSAQGSGGKEPGSGSGAPVLVLGTTGTRQVVQMKVKADQQELAHVGESAPVTLPDGSVVQGTITEVGTVASESSEGERGGGGEGGGGGESGNGENATIAVTAVLEHRVARLDEAPVSVELVKSIRRGVLAVPATALVATGGGGYAIEVLEGSRREQLRVMPGMFANGYVQVEGAGVHAGLTVLEPQ
jgi:peptidoglycan hydrolase-like protein with peptidoglycan-binding domain